MKTSGFVEYVVHDLLSALRGIRARAMFGGWGIYKDGVIFAIIVDDQLYFKVDDANRREYQQRGSRPFTYASHGKSVAMSYWEVPADVLDDREELERWAEASHRISRQIAKVETRDQRKRKARSARGSALREDRSHVSTE